MTPQTIVQQLEHRAIDELIPYAGNARTHSPAQIAQIAESIREFGFINPILIATDGTIIAGHGRLLAAKKLAMTHVPVIVVGHLTSTQYRALAIADNRLALNAGWDEEMLRSELAALEEQNFDTTNLGFDDEELARLLAESETVTECADAEAIPEKPKTPVSLVGDLWILGDRHRVVCGDPEVPAYADFLMASHQADLLITDVPSQVYLAGDVPEGPRIATEPMTREEFQAILRKILVNCERIVKPVAPLYIGHSWSRQQGLLTALEAAGFAVDSQLIWVRDTLEPTGGRYRLQHQPVFYAHVAGRTERWYGDGTQSTLWEATDSVPKRAHPFTQPVSQVERALANSSRPGDLVLDCFGGCGSTLIACERTGRKARLIEGEPKYVDVIVRRWQRYTGQPAVQGDGRTFDQVAAKRLSKPIPDRPWQD